MVEGFSKKEKRFMDKGKSVVTVEGRGISGRDVIEKLQKLYYLKKGIMSWLVWLSGLSASM